ncbi:hypothetical protein TSAR_002887 [Trichomalopsis sarcophagae]|uniref:Uncharacterized protein n=1 Tax=Trichomalopsis sarcophagae TaxID=543379 RepID=A0A232EG35_9HYME|nr:hypothetical protein TSAR_002887 [Trichomalopsis sarcophagae]
MCPRERLPPLNFLAWQSQTSPLAFLH